MGTTTNLGLTTFDVASGSVTTFLDYRLAIDGNSSNMSIIDAFAGNTNNSISVLQQGVPSTINASRITGNYFESTSSAITGYPINLSINVKVNATISGSMTFNINSFGVRAVKKISSNGSLVDMQSGDVLINNYYPMIYDGTNFIVTTSNFNTAASSLAVITGSSIMSDTTGSIVKHNISGVVSGSYNQVIVDKWGHVTAGSFVNNSSGSTSVVSVTTYYSGSVSNPPTQTEITAILGSPFTAGPGKMFHINDSDDFTKEYFVSSDGYYWWIIPMVKTSYIEPTSASATNAPNPLTIPTYDGSGQAVHPDVIYFTDGWNGYKYWMIMTPYPASNAQFENPSILNSNDGTTWTVPTGLTNPLANWPGGAGSNGDVALLMTPDNITMYAFWYETNGSSTNKIKYRTTTSGSSFVAEQTLFDVPYFTLTVPTFLYDGSQYRCWSVDITASPYLMHQRTCATPVGTYSGSTLCTWVNKPSKDIWHIDVFKHGKMYHGFFTFCDTATYGNNSTLYFATSPDGLVWTVQSSPLLAPTGGSTWDRSYVYRSCGVPTATGYDVFYSAWRGDTNQWHIGRTPATLGQ